jgi:hypothetical protein
MDVLAFIKARLKPQKRRIAASRYKKAPAAEPVGESASEPPDASAEERVLHGALSET